MEDQTFDGTRSLKDLAANNPIQAAQYGKAVIKDVGKKLAQIQGLKPGGVSLRTPEMIEEMVMRLVYGETLTSITSDDHMPCYYTVYKWRRADSELDELLNDAQAQGQNVLGDIRLDIAQMGVFSTGDRQQDQFLVRVIDKNMEQRNSKVFGNSIKVDNTHRVEPVILPTIALPSPDGYDDYDDDDGDPDA